MSQVLIAGREARKHPLWLQLEDLRETLEVTNPLREPERAINLGKEIVQVKDTLISNNIVDVLKYEPFCMVMPRSLRAKGGRLK